MGSFLKKLDYLSTQQPTVMLTVTTGGDIIIRGSSCMLAEQENFLEVFQQSVQVIPEVVSSKSLKADTVGNDEATITTELQLLQNLHGYCYYILPTKFLLQKGDSRKSRYVGSGIYVRTSLVVMASGPVMLLGAEAVSVELAGVGGESLSITSIYRAPSSDSATSRPAVIYYYRTCPSTLRVAIDNGEKKESSWYRLTVTLL
ncbi:uncharacterized protein [Watersipora subatra]|uniref:uncharacterized protein n=1 Tax=Watersipora subatra TaxID=2589382 RepID=UPI00355C9D96